MENLITLETENFDLDNMTDEQLEVQANKILFVRQKIVIFHRIVVHIECTS